MKFIELKENEALNVDHILRIVVQDAGILIYMTDKLVAYAKTEFNDKIEDMKVKLGAFLNSN